MCSLVLHISLTKDLRTQLIGGYTPMTAHLDLTPSHDDQPLFRGSSLFEMIEIGSFGDSN